MSKKISQRTARMYKKRCEEMERILSRQRNRWASEWAAGWINIETLILEPASFAKVATARLLKHAVVLQCGDDGRTVRLYADQL